MRRIALVAATAAVAVFGSVATAELASAAPTNPNSCAQQQESKTATNSCSNRMNHEMSNQNRDSNTTNHEGAAKPAQNGAKPATR